MHVAARAAGATLTAEGVTGRILGPLQAERLVWTTTTDATVITGLHLDWRSPDSLLFALREKLGFPGAKNACEQGECGSCSVLLDGVLVCACLVLAAQADGHDVTTVEGLSDGDALHPVQSAFVEAGAVQCGFCTPGLVVAAADLLARTPNPSDDEIREALSGNLCRCTGYEKISDAVRLASQR